MATVIEILNFNFSVATMQHSAANSFPSKLTRLIDSRIVKLNSITEDVGQRAYKNSGETFIPQVFKKFKSIMREGGLLMDNFERRELRTLTFSLSHSEYNNPQIFSKPTELDFVFETLETNWKDSYLIGLIDCYLNNWETQHKSSAEKLSDFIYKKLRNYKGERKVLKSLKANMKFFDSRSGDVLLGSELAIKNKQIKEATKYLSLPESWFAYPYFSKVILAYYVKRKNDIQQFIDDLNNALQEHKNPTSNKRLVSKLIIQANEQEFSALQDKVKSIAFKLVGDPGNVSNWTAFENATETEKEELKKARAVLNEWITRQFINVFFEKCINDSRRKRFWLKYAKEIVQFRVVGSTVIHKILLNDNRISEYVSQRFSKTNSVRDRNAALMFIMKNHLFVEFSDEGSFYAYKLSNDNAPSIDKEWFYSTNDLKLTYLLQLVDRQGYYITYMAEEGKLPHRDGKLDWEDAATYWLKNKAGINV
jgi:EH_Signature domain